MLLNLEFDTKDQTFGTLQDWGTILLPKFTFFKSQAKYNNATIFHTKGYTKGIPGFLFYKISLES